MRSISLRNAEQAITRRAISLPSIDQCVLQGTLSTMPVDNHKSLTNWYGFKRVTRNLDTSVNM